MVSEMQKIWLFQPISWLAQLHVNLTICTPTSHHYCYIELKGNPVCIVSFCCWNDVVQTE